MVNEETQTRQGRPLAFSSVEELDSAISTYFNSRDPHIVKTRIKTQKADGTFYWQDDEELTPARPKTMSGLARALGVHRTTLINYKDRPEFFDSIARALDECEEYAEEQLFIGRSSNGAAFVLKNNYGWTDKREVESSVRTLTEELDDLDAEHEEVARMAALEIEKLQTQTA